MDLTRRDAVKTAATISALSWSRILGANDRIGLGVIGLGERGTYVMTVFQKNPEIEVRALCDVWAQRMGAARQKASNAKTLA
ncbi:MAG TPA: gfo/Idh/MocA family oxidoreductase, partial [Bryobacteraceae bacterium]|nr:gfo/Idh/MocA family oxidoreductase [Bryobacteraceae bacterium]